MARKIRNGEVTVTTIISVECEVVCQVYPGYPGSGERGYSLGEPPEPPSAEIVSIISMRGSDLTRVADELDRDTLADIERAALEIAADAEGAAREDADDRRAEEYRERARGID